MGYQIVKDDGELTMTLAQEAFLRTLHGFRAISYRALFNTRNKEEGKLWLDEKFGTHTASLNSRAPGPAIVPLRGLEAIYSRGFALRARCRSIYPRNLTDGCRP